MSPPHAADRQVRGSRPGEGPSLSLSFIGALREGPMRSRWPGRKKGVDQQLKSESDRSHWSLWEESKARRVAGGRDDDGARAATRCKDQRRTVGALGCMNSIMAHEEKRVMTR